MRNRLALRLGSSLTLTLAFAAVTPAALAGELLLAPGSTATIDADTPTTVTCAAPQAQVPDYCSCEQEPARGGGTGDTIWSLKWHRQPRGYDIATRLGDFYWETACSEALLATPVCTR